MSGLFLLWQFRERELLLRPFVSLPDSGFHLLYLSQLEASLEIHTAVWWAAPPGTLMSTWRLTKR